MNENVGSLTSYALKKAVIFAPFWRQRDHVGNNRVDRFTRWLAASGYRVVMIRAGSMDATREEPWGLEITVRDPLGIYHDPQSEGWATTKPRKPNKWRRMLAYLVFNPDPTVVWARAAARHRGVLAAIEGADFILSSSPPESAHVGAWLLSRKTTIPHIVDMRDGWLDEPIKPLLSASALRRWQEVRLERRILLDAKGIQVTSIVWQNLLCSRYPQLSGKVQVLTNGYPENAHVLRTRDKQRLERDITVLVHAGRFTGSHLTRTPDLLLEPLLTNIANAAKPGVIKLIGALTEQELDQIELFKPRFKAIDWEIETFRPMPRSELLEQLPAADGLLLLSASYAALPSKLFEYIPTELPIFVVAEKESATWKICESLPQAKMVEIECVPTNENIVDGGRVFFENVEYFVPEDYSEYELGPRFVAFVES